MYNYYKQLSRTKKTRLSHVRGLIANEIQSRKMNEVLDHSPKILVAQYVNHYCL